MDRELIRERLAAFTKLPPEAIADEKGIMELVADSFVLVEMMLALQEEYGIVLAQEDLADVRTVADLLTLVLTRHATMRTAHASSS